MITRILKISSALLTFLLASMLLSQSPLGAMVSKTGSASFSSRRLPKAGGQAYSDMRSLGGSGPGGSVALPVPYHPQIKPYYCGEAALMMAFHYYGPWVSQYEIANVARADPVGGTYSDEMRRAAHFSNSSTAQGNDAPGYNCTGYTDKDLGYGAFEWWFSLNTSLSQLKGLVDQGYPTIVLMWYNSSYLSGHYRVVMGYDSTGIVAHDPLTGGSQYYYNSQFLDLWSYSYYWGLYTSPWLVSINAPTAVAVNSTFMLNATITYLCPSPFGAYDGYPADTCKATIKLPAGLSLASGENSSKTLSPSPFYYGQSRTVTWGVVAGATPDQYSVTVLAEGIVHGSVSGHGSYLPYSYNDRIGGSNSTSIGVKPVYLVTFSQTGLDQSASSTVLTVNSAAKYASDLPFKIWVIEDGVVNYSWEVIVSSNLQDTRFSLAGVTGPPSPVIVSGNVSITASYSPQYLVTFTRTGLDSTSNGPVVTINGTTKTFASLPYSFWVSTGNLVAYSYVSFPSSSESGKRFRLDSVGGPASPFAVVGPITVDCRYVVQYAIAFAQSGLDATARGTVLTVNGGEVESGQLPYNLWADNYTSVAYEYHSPVSSNASDKRFKLNAVSGSSSPIFVSGATAVSGSYIIQYLVVFSQTGLDPTADGTVIAIDGDAKTFAELPHGNWVNIGGSVTYSWNSLVSNVRTDKRFRLISVSGPPSPINVAGAATVTGNYVAQYLIGFSQSGVGSDFAGTVVTIDSVDYNVLTLPVQFWSDEDSGHAFAFASPLSATPAKCYVWASTSGPSGLQSDYVTVEDSGNITGNYNTQYLMIYINADGSIEPSTAPISTSDNVTYTLFGDINITLRVFRDNIVIAGAGHAVCGRGVPPDPDNPTIYDVAVLIVGRTNVTVTGMNIGNFDTGLYIEDCHSCIITENTIENSGFSDHGGGIRVSSSDHMTISRNNLTANYAFGIQTEFSNWNMILENNLAGNDGGIWLDADSGHNSILGNILTGNNVSVRLQDSDNNVFSLNTITGGSYGILLFGGTWPLPEGSSLIENNTITGNNVTQSTYGLWCVFSANNSIYHNSFRNVTHEVLTDSQKPSRDFWDNGYPSGGNFWSTYSGGDAYTGSGQNETGPDGIGDTPYIVNEYGRDNYPLSSPWAPPDIAVTDVLPSKTIVGRGFTLSANQTISNQGNKIERLTCSLFVNDILVASQTLMLKAGRAITITLSWNTLGFGKGNYALWTGIEPLPCETDAADNNCAGGNIIVSTVGDVDGNGVVDIFDLVGIAARYDSRTGDPGYSPECDIVYNGLIDIFDVVACAVHYEEPW